MARSNHRESEALVADTEAEARAWRDLGRQLAASRKAAGLSQQKLAPLSGYTRSTIANAETGRQHLPRDFWKRCDDVLDTGTALTRGHDEIAALQRGRHVHSAVIAHRARTTAGRRGEPEPALGAGDTAGDGPGLAQVESMRQWLTGILTDGAVSRGSIEAWEQAVVHHGRDTRTRPAAEHLPELSADLTELGQTIQRCRSAASLRDLTRVAAHLSGLACLLFVKLDERYAFRRWAATARVAAAESGHPATLSWILAQEAYGHFYSGDLTAAVATAQQARELMRHTPLVGAALAAALEARAQAARGRTQQAHTALDHAERILAMLEPGSVTASAFGYTESQLRFHQSNAYTRLRDTRRALAAQDRALLLCPSGDYTDWALTRLDRASCIGQTGDPSAAVAYATETLSHLRVAHSQGIIALRVGEFVRALPSGYRSTDPVRELEDLLTPTLLATKEITGP